MHWSQKASRPNLITWSYGFFGFGEKKVGRLGGVVDTPWTAMTTSTRAPVMLIITVETSQWQEQILEIQLITEEDRIKNRVGVWSFTWNIKLCKQRIHINYFILKIKQCKLSWIAPFNSEDIPMARLQEGESGQQLPSAHSQLFVTPSAPRSEKCLE